MEPSRQRKFQISLLFMISTVNLISIPVVMKPLPSNKPDNQSRTIYSISALCWTCTTLLHSEYLSCVHSLQHYLLPSYNILINAHLHKLCMCSAQVLFNVQHQAGDVVDA